MCEYNVEPSVINKLKIQVLELSYKFQSSHISSCINSISPLYNIYLNKKPHDEVILSCGHAGLGLYVVLEHFKESKLSAAELYKKYGTHPKYDKENGILFSGGSLGIGATFSLGRAILGREKGYDVHVIMSDGELSEGICWEALLVKGKLELDNLKTHFIINGYGAVSSIKQQPLIYKILEFDRAATLWQCRNSKMFEGVQGHYRKIQTQEELENLMKDFM